MAKKKIMVIKDIDRNEIDFICKTIMAVPCPHIDQFTEAKLGSAGLVEESSSGGSE